jgi:hypothetical protein
MKDEMTENCGMYKETLKHGSYPKRCLENVSGRQNIKIIKLKL